MRVTLLAVVLSLGLSSVFANVICDTKRHIGVNDTDVSIELNDTIGFFIKTFCYARVQDGGVAAEQCRSALLAITQFDHSLPVDADDCITHFENIVD